MARVFREFGHIPVDRADTQAAASTIQTGVELLVDGKVLAIYPEGSPDGRPHKVRSGVVRLPLRSGAPVIPVGLLGTGQVLIPGDRRWHRSPVAVHLGPALDFSGRVEAVQPWTSPGGPKTNDHRRSSARSPKQCARQSSDCPDLTTSTLRQLGKKTFQQHARRAVHGQGRGLRGLRHGAHPRAADRTGAVERCPVNCPALGAVVGCYGEHPKDFDLPNGPSDLVSSWLGRLDR